MARTTTTAVTQPLPRPEGRWPALRRRPTVRYRTFILLSLLPVMSFFFLFTVLPTIAAVYLSFFNYSFIDLRRPFVGFGNFVALAKDPLFRQALRNTLVFVGLTVPLNLSLSLPIAIGLNRIHKLRAFFRACFYLPTVTSLAAVSLVWLYLYDPVGGLINAVFKLFHLPGQAWLQNPALALPAVVFVYVWQDLGYNVIIFLAALQGIPDTYYEAAKLDGAGSWTTFRRITLPLLGPTMTVVSVLTVISAFKVFIPVHIMTQGGPMNSTKVLVYYIYENAFSYLKMGYASAMAVILFIIILALTLIQFKALRSDWSY